MHHFSKFSWRSIPLCHAQHAASRYAYIAYTSEKDTLLYPVMYANLSLFQKKYYVKKDQPFLTLKRSTSILKNNPTLVVSIVLQKYYFHGVCEFSIKKKQLNIHTFLCVRLNSLI